MSTWDPASYGTFLDLRTRPSVDLLQRIAARTLALPEAQSVEELTALLTSAGER